MNFLKYLSDETIRRKYELVGTIVGCELCYTVRSPDFRRLVVRLEQLEEEFARRGYRTVHLDEFVRAGGSGEDISGLLGVKRGEAEAPISHVRPLLEKTPHIEPSSISSLWLHE